MASNQPLPISEMVVSHIDHETIMQEIMATHNPDSKDFQVNFIFNSVKNILCPITVSLFILTFYSLPIIFYLTHYSILSYCLIIVLKITTLLFLIVFIHPINTIHSKSGVNVCIYIRLIEIK
nr:protein SIEVE ELEMENT OCCLUSION B-like [Ipomoea batatas]